MLRNALLAVLAAAPVVSQGAAPTPDEAAQSHVAAASRAAATTWAAQLPKFCSLYPVERVSPVAAVKPGHPIPPPPAGDWHVPPRKVFDNLYFIGSKEVSTFALVTKAGIIVLDGQGNIDRDGSIVPGLLALGLDPRQIRYVIIPHGHPDHYGGARYFQQEFGAKIVAPKADMGELRWYAERVIVDAPERIDVFVGDGSTLTLGDVTIEFHEVPGHTPGGVVMSLPVTENGKPHRMLIWASGGAGPIKARDIRAQIPGLERLVERAKRTHVDALADNHGSHLLLEKWAPGTSNPFLVGEEALQGYLTMRLECDRARLAANP